MPKRKYEEKIEYYKRKLDKIRSKQRRKRRRIDDATSSSDQGNNYVVENYEDSYHGLVPDEVFEEATNECLLEAAKTQQIEQTATPVQTLVPTPGPALEPSEEPDLVPLEPQLDPEILSALGEATDEGPMWGQDIHINLSQLWLPLLKKGMTKDGREKILKEYLVPSNCTLLQAPKLNMEISAAVQEMVRIRDKKVEGMQQQLGSGITAVSRAMTSLLNNEDKIQVLKTLSDACRILCDLHYSETQARIKMVTPGLTKTFLNIIQDSERDETLFGSTLPDKIKASKTVEKQGLQIKKTGPAPRSSTVSQSQSTTRQQFQGNWAGPSRYPTNRGGAGRSETIPCGSPSVGSTGSCNDVAAQARPEPLTCPCSTVTQTTTSAPRDAFPGSRAAIRLAFSRRGTPPTALRLMLDSLSDSTIKQYGVCYKLWWQYCRSNACDVFDSTVTHVITFLSELYEKGATYGSLSSHRSALSLLTGINLASDEYVKRLLKGVFRSRPSLPKYTSTWDPQVVLDHVSKWFPHDQLKLDRLTQKLVVLLALCTAHRVQTFSLIKLCNLKINPNYIEIPITDIIKTSGVGRVQPVLYLPYFRDNPSICPATTLVDYMSATKDLRPSNVDHLLITVKRPHRNAQHSL